MGRVPARHSYSLSLLLQGLASACISGGISLYGSIDDCFENGVAPAMPFPLEEGEERDGAFLLSWEAVGFDMHFPVHGFVCLRLFERRKAPHERDSGDGKTEWGPICGRKIRDYS